MYIFAVSRRTTANENIEKNEMKKKIDLYKIYARRREQTPED